MVAAVRKRCLILLACLAATIPGCGSGPALGEVEGLVTANGKPLQGIQVMFSPIAGKAQDGRMSTAVTDQNGRYVLAFDDRKQPRSGAIVGKHKVVLIDAAWEDARGLPNRGLKRVPDQYTTFETTPLEFDVVAGAQSIPIAIKPQ
jgi:hypothetical protein